MGEMRHAASPPQFVDLRRQSGGKRRAPLPIGATKPDAAEATLVDGVLCARQHFNNPRATYCARCGISMLQQTLYMVKGPRPPLGVIVLDDGSTFGLTGDYIVGRDPVRDPAVSEQRAHPLVVNDEQHTVSRVHAELRLRDWSVEIVDRSSANGTFLRDGAHEWTRLEPEMPVELSPGAEVRLGGRRLLFESHQR